MEVGSGSGGTSVVVMEALADLGERIEFIYTDISPQLVAYGRKTYGPRYPFARFRALDVERDVGSQVRTRQIRPIDNSSLINMLCTRYHAGLRRGMQTHRFSASCITCPLASLPPGFHAEWGSCQNRFSCALLLARGTALGATTFCSPPTCCMRRATWV